MQRFENESNEFGRTLCENESFEILSFTLKGKKKKDFDPKFINYFTIYLFIHRYLTDTTPFFS